MDFLANPAQVEHFMVAMLALRTANDSGITPALPLQAKPWPDAPKFYYSQRQVEGGQMVWVIKEKLDA